MRAGDGLEGIEHWKCLKRGERKGRSERLYIFFSFFFAFEEAGKPPIVTADAVT